MAIPRGEDDEGPWPGRRSVHLPSRDKVHMGDGLFNKLQLPPIEFLPIVDQFPGYWTDRDSLVNFFFEFSTLSQSVLEGGESSAWISLLLSSSPLPSLSRDKNGL